MFGALIPRPFFVANEGELPRLRRAARMGSVRRAFTLIELLVVIAIIAISTASLPPSPPSANPGNRGASWLFISRSGFRNYACDGP